MSGRDLAESVRRRAWQFVHHCIAHPVFFLSGFAGWAERFHDWTGERA